MKIDYFTFTMDMLAELLGRNKQHLTRKIKQMSEDPAVLLKVKLNSRKEGYRIPADEVVRCFGDEITPKQVQNYIDRVSAEPPKEEQPTRLFESENELLLAWRIRLASTAPSEQKTEKMRAYLNEQLQKIQQMQIDKIREQVLLKELLERTESAIHALKQYLYESERD